MDLASYASELIKQHGQLFVPGLGFFAHVRKSSYYDQETGSLYPPYFQIVFEGHRRHDEDTTLAAYIAEKKNISLASSKYFLDKFVNKIKFDAETNEVPFADLGYFYTDHHAKLAFQASRIQLSQNASLFGYQPISFQKLRDLGQPVKPRPETPPIPVTDNEPEAEPVSLNVSATEGPVAVTREQPSEETASAPPAPVEVTPAEPTPAPLKMVSLRDSMAPSGRVQVTNLAPQPATEEPAPDFNDDYVENDEDEEGLGVVNNMRFWVLVVVVVLAATGGLVWYYKYRFSNFMKPHADQQKHTSAKAQTVAASAGASFDTTHSKTADTSQSLSSAPKVLSNTADSMKAAAQKTDDQVKPAAAAAVKPVIAIDSIPKNSWLVTAGQDANFDAITARLKHYRDRGYKQARLVDSIPHAGYFVYKIILGHAATRGEAEKMRADLLAQGNLNPKYIQVQPFK